LNKSRLLNKMPNVPDIPLRRLDYRLLKLISRPNKNVKQMLFVLKERPNRQT
jgi:hypothetical protein